VYLSSAIVAAPTYEDGYVAYLDNLYWAEQYDQAHGILGIAKKAFGEPLPDEIHYKESRLLYFEQKYEESY
jgi:hypothetical protein